MQDQAKAAGWTKPVPTALLVMADGTVIEGFGFGAVGSAVGEVCFNTAMTGYQEILTDPSYAGQIVTFTFPHIGNVGANDEDVETVDFARIQGARGVIVQAPVGDPSNFRANIGLDAWLKSRNIIGLSGIDTRALTALIREKGMPNAVIAHAPDGRFDVEALKAEAKAWPGIDGMDLVPGVTAIAGYDWRETTWKLGVGYGEQASTKYKVVALDFGVKRNILRLLADAGCAVHVAPATTSAEEILALEPDGVFLSNGPGDPAETGKYAVPTIQKILEAKIPTFGICLGHQMMALAVGAKTTKMHQGHHGANHPVQDFDHPQGGDRVDEPRLRGRSRQPSGQCGRNAQVTVRRQQLRHRAHRPPGLFGPAPSRSLARPAGQPLSVRALCRDDGEAQGGVTSAALAPRHASLHARATRIDRFRSVRTLEAFGREAQPVSDCSLSIFS